MLQSSTFLRQLWLKLWEVKNDASDSLYGGKLKTVYILIWLQLWLQQGT
jgi:hypothetical protein